MSKRLALGLLLAVLVLGWVFQWFFGNLFYDLLWSWLDGHGVHEAKLIAFISQNMIPFLLAFLVITGVYFFVRFELQHFGASPARATVPSPESAVLHAPPNWPHSATVRAFDAFREEQTLTFLRGRPLKLEVGEDGAFFETKSQLHSCFRTLKIKVSNSSHHQPLSGCKLQVLSIEPNEATAPWVLEEGFSLAAGDHAFVPLARYCESLSGKRSSGATFIEILAKKNAPTLSYNSVAVLTLRATALDSPFCDLKCKIWVDASGRLRVGDENAETDISPTDDILSIQDAAQIAYERAETDGWLDVVVGKTSDPQQRLETFKYMMLVQAQHHAITLSGVEPPSTQSRPIPTEMVAGLHPALGESVLRHITPNQIAYHTVTISKSDLEKVIEIYQAVVQNAGAGA